jgi:RimJ/RimL family protein N-acetyltransferase
MNPSGRTGPASAYDRPVFPIELGPITLRLFDATDFDEFYAYWALPSVARYMRWPPNDPDEARAGLARRIDSNHLDQPGDRIMPAIIDPATGAIAGEAMLNWEEGEHLRGEVGFALHPDYQGRGFARAAAAEMLRIGFAEVGLHRIFGGCDARNDPSAGLLTRLGLRQEARLRDYEFIKGEWCDELIFAILADEWRATQAE